MHVNCSGFYIVFVSPWCPSSKPSFKTNCIDDWEKKIDAIVDETLCENMTLISGIPPWVQMYFERIVKRTNKKIKPGTTTLKQTLKHNRL